MGSGRFGVPVPIRRRQPQRRCEARLTGISFLLFVRFSVDSGLLNIAGLPLLRSARKQNHDGVSIPAIVHPVSRAVVNPKFREARIKPLVISEVSATHAVNALLDTGNDIDILLQEPFRWRMV